MPDTATIRERKRQIRETTLERRDRMTAGRHRQASARICRRLLELPEVQQARSLFVFISFGSEVDTHPLIDALLNDGRRVAIPRIMDRTSIRAVPMTSWDDLEAGKWGILSPRSAEPAPDPFDVAVIPGVAFTERRARLGHGRGYYDRWLAAHAVATSIAVAFELQIVPEVPVEAHDRPVDRLVTEERVLPSTGTS